MKVFLTLLMIGNAINAALSYSSFLNPDKTKQVKLGENKPQIAGEMQTVEAGLVTSFTTEFFNKHN